MLETTEKLIKEVNELKTLCVNEALKDVFNEYSTDTTVVLYRRMFQLMDTSMELLKEQAALMDGINNKLDKLLKKTES